MRYALFLPAVLLFAAVVSGASCGGSASETPWPVEPEATQYAPPGESATPPAITEERPDGGKPKRP
jgi:hypothetical protein